MPEPTPPPAREQAALVALAGAAIWAFALSRRQPAAWLLLAPCAASLVMRVRRLPAWARAAARRGCRGLLAGVFVFGLAWTLYPVLPERVVDVAPLVFGYSLGLCAVLFLLGSSVWPLSSAALPAAVGLLLTACLEPMARLEGPLALAAAALLAYLAVSSPAKATAGAPRGARRLLRVAVFASMAAPIALSFVRFLPWAQPHVEAATADLLNTGSTSYSGLSSSSRLGAIEELALSRRVVLRVWTPRARKLRARVYTRFDGLAWKEGKAAVIDLAPVAVHAGALGDWLDTIPGTLFALPGVEAGAGESPGAVHSKIVQAVFNSGALLAPAGVLMVRAPAGRPRLNRFGILQPLSPAAEIYGLVSDEPASAVSHDGGACEDCLAVPGDLDPRVKELAARLVGDARSPEERVQRTTAFLGRECHYSLSVGRFRSRQPLAEFLFEKKRGYCEFFASAAAVLLRLEGVPTRYVSGFNVTEDTRRGDHYLVREADAHAWVECWLPPQGWVEVDATPAGEYEALHAPLRGGWTETLAEWFRSRLRELGALISSGEWRAAFGCVAREARALLRAALDAKPGPWLLLLLATGVAGGLLRRRRGRGRAPALIGEPGLADAELARLAARVDASCARLGFPRPVSRAPLEHLEALPRARVAADWLEASRAVVERFYRARFGGVAADPAEIAELRARLNRTGPA